MGCCYAKENLAQSLITDPSLTLIPEIIINKLSNSVAMIELGEKISIGFFMKINFRKKKHNFILTCEHSISQEDISSKKKLKYIMGKLDKSLK